MGPCSKDRVDEQFDRPTSTDGITQRVFGRYLWPDEGPMDKGIEKHDRTLPSDARKASGRPGDKPLWSSGAKSLVGTSASAPSRIWFTIGNGTLNEIYFPDVDQANTRSVRFLVSDGQSFFSDEQWDADHTVEWLEPGVPGCRIHSRCKAGRYRLAKEIFTDPVRDTLLMRVSFEVADSSNNLKLYLFAEPHLGDRGADNSAWIGHYKGVQILLAKRADVAMGIAFEPALIAASCGYVGRTDGLTELSRFKSLSDANLAEKGNVALTGEIDWKSMGGKFTVAIAYGSRSAEAAQQARAGILQDLDKTRALFVQCWKEHHSNYAEVEDLSGHALDMYRVSTTVLETHQSKRFPGAFIASLSMPWGFDRSDKDIGGYHVLWPRDLVETAMGKLASGDARSARSSLFYLACTQDENGGWSQNMWLDGTMHWGAIQMDGMALPIQLADKLRRENALDGYDPAPMVHGAASFLVRHGLVSQQGRWEATPGYSVYTVATEIAALLQAAEFATPEEATFLRDTADAWYDSIDELLYAKEPPLAKEHDVSGYYMRATPPEMIESKDVGHLRVLMPNHHFGGKHRRAIDVVSPDSLALVRFGLRRADDPRIVNTVKVLDATLKRDTKTGPGWVRSSYDGYGETADGAPFKKAGIGRVWPLLAGERGHYEIALGNYDFALELLRTMSRQTSQGGMIPEQVWDVEEIPSRFLFNGHPAGSGMPLVWAHSEYIKLLRSLHANAVWDLPIQTVERYLKEGKSADFQIWTPKQRRAWLAPGKNLRVDLPSSAEVAWTVEGKSRKIHTTDSSFGIHTAMLPVSRADSEIKVIVTFDVGNGNPIEADSFLVRVGE
jgi:glucoamylase